MHTATRRTLCRSGLVAAAAALVARVLPHTPRAATPAFALTLSDAEWHRRLTPRQYAVLRDAATEAPFSSPLLDEHRSGRFTCAGCTQALFDSHAKYDSGTGWPSFFEALPQAVQQADDPTFGMQRTEIHCAHCGGHLGHLFDDGPRPTGLRYCMNGAALGFTPA
ncbi:peptide-methionine (R)-S-oxide reductase [Endobacter medicaginis]|uniref:peptide-methionine (R)-S-oxide reductase n=1 Tax=Endobacter medicaginis TaxID=1181271 RepID=A0A839UY79_9PROT|nr:peptide-methionine (R)-S-oxide reductase MsrB [Endobacter medicaginis]MBB3173080.1 peptide-methionine (R)-S-oxide reductase [Endobacter medicaginis]MCX5474495.1 peptide-methionine (R)-S-oxide reductase MsrB [Endobacter medicaginis]NVN31512.1 peptide-methionine (R)-S-oxide reductase MsrB [Endobacter medicaginis]